MARTRMSSKGQVIIPKAIRVARKWDAGVELDVENLADGVRLNQVEPQKKLSIRDVAGCLRKYYSGPPIAARDMERIAAREFAKEWRRKERAQRS